mmetsp:Transcript_7973/g.9457  ORF Transcript_7973/g.9457 Transcript_7973/m.9457 type:complete len:114 (+) Transcript_7973:27-368(+)|eukprot:Skav215980  [mRNA]  locus=scaffold1856:67334:68156:+ [translate_table: standard]
MARPVLCVVMVAAAVVALLSQSMAFLAGPKEVPRSVVVPAAGIAPMLMASAAHAETLDSNWIDPSYQDPKEVSASSDLGYLLFFFAISVVAIARDVFSKSDSKSLKEAVLGKD